MLEQRGVPEQRKIVENHVVFGERHVVRQPGPGQRDVDVVDQLAVLVDHAVSHVRFPLAVVEEQQFTGFAVHLRMRGHTPIAREAPIPTLLAQRFTRIRIDPVQVAALVEARQCDAPVHDDVGARCVLHPGAGAPALLALGQLHRLGESRPQRLAGFVLRQEAVGADKPVAVEGVSVAEADHVQHAVAVERVIGLQRRVERVFGVAQVDAIQVARDFPFHGGEVVGVPLGVLGTPRSGPVRVVVIFRQRGQELADDLNIHVTHLLLC